ncbi:MAG: hypothetical protein AB7O28_04815 [Vicinamibacterales bacterium]
MTCCGRQRVQAAGVGPPVTFEYVGRSAIRVVGVGTRRTYWFPKPGARVVVDRRDAASLAAVPHLAPVRDAR